MSQYPGPDPDDPFAKQPNEDGTPSAPSAGGTEETAPIQRDEVGYWERLAQAQGGQQPPTTPSYQQNPTSAQPSGDSASQQVESNPWAGYGEPAQQGSPPPPPPNPYGAPVPPYGAQPYGAQPYGAQPYGAQPPSPYGYGGGYTGYAQQSHPQSTTALVLGLIGLIGGCACAVPLLLSPFAWWIGGKARKEIAASNGQLGGQGNAQAGWVMGIIGTVLLVLGVLAIAGLFIIGISTSDSSYSSTEF